MAVRVLVTGWFGFLHGEATAGDLLARDAVCAWLERAGVPYDRASSPVLADGVDGDHVDPGRYSHVVFVCGPLAGPQVEELTDRFAGCTRIAVGVTLVGDPVEDHWEVLPRDDPSGTAARPDLALLPALPRLPLVGFVRAPSQPEYPDGEHSQVHGILEHWLMRRRLAVLNLDTRIDPRQLGYQSPAQVESMLGALDVVVTTRLHGMVLALKHGTPALAVDPVPGGGKVCAQARILGWPICLVTDDLGEDRLDEALGRCLDPSSRRAASRAAARGVAALSAVEGEITAALGLSGRLGPR